jgi:PAS domain S-box-containing protein
MATAMTESEDLLRQSQRVARLGHYVLDIASDRWTCSEMLDEIFGLTAADDHTLATWIGRLHPDHQRDMIDYFTKKVIGERQSFDREYQVVNRRSGQSFWVHGLGNLEFSPEGRPVRMFGTIQDITARKQAEVALAESKAQLQAVFDGVSDGLVVADLEGRRFLLANRGFHELTGYGPDDVLRLGVDKLHPPEALPYVVGWFERQARGEVVVAPDIPVRRKDGRVVLCDVSAAAIDVAGRRCLMGSFRDTTYRRQVEHELRLKTFVFDSAMTANSIADTQGIVVEANQAFLRIWGFERLDQVLGKKVPEFLAHEHEARAILKALEATGAWAGEYTAKRPDGSTFVASSQATALRNERGEVVGYQSSVLDVTLQKRAEEDKEKLHEQLVQAQKMESVGRLAGGVAHDFNNMLGVILGYTDLLLDAIDDADPNHATIVGIRSATQRSAELTRQLLAFARKQTVTPRVLDLNAAVTGLLKMLRRLIGEDISLEWKPGESVWPVKIDPSQVDQILANLCVNARDAISSVGRVVIETRNRTLDETWSETLAEVTPGDYVLLTVSDDGCGMDATVRAHLFEPFFTTKEVGQGTGLGLAMLYGIVKQNGGFINVYSEPGQGSTFRIYLPRHAGDASLASDTGAAPIQQGRHATVLLVEDEPMLLEMCRHMLEGLGYRVLPAGTPSEAIRLADERSHEIELLVTDVIMPEMNGIELAARLLSRYPGLKRLYMSGYTANVFARDGLLDEGVHFLQKPFSRRELASAVHAALEDG